jgi:hypothetical protein
VSITQQRANKQITNSPAKIDRAEGFRLCWAIPWELVAIGFATVKNVLRPVGLRVTNATVTMLVAAIWTRICIGKVMLGEGEGVNFQLKALAHGGLAVCRDKSQAATEALRVARAINSDPGTLARMRQLFELLVPTDAEGILAGLCNETSVRTLSAVKVS